MIGNTELLDNIITGYVPHKIYAFSTPQLLKYLKVGETSRSINVRLLEWKKLISDLKLEKDWLAMLPKDAADRPNSFRITLYMSILRIKGYNLWITMMLQEVQKNFIR